jgi:hypothetical protein
MTQQLRWPHHIGRFATMAVFAVLSATACQGHGTTPSGQGAGPSPQVSSGTAVATPVSQGAPGSMTTEPGGPPMSTGSIELQSRAANAGLTQVGMDVFQLAANPPAGIPPQLTFNWAYSDQGQPATAGACTVTAELTGPQNYDQQQRSTDCVGSPASAFDVTVPGIYGISVEITPPGGGSPTAATRTVTVQGSHG